MNEYSLDGKKGFHVLCESQTWRIACHVYEEAVNGVTAVENWGIHLDSQETFTLLEGRAYLAIKKTDGEMDFKILERNKMYVVECGEPHLLVLEEASKILITENRNMENSVTESATDEEIAKIKMYVRD